MIFSGIIFHDQHENRLKILVCEIHETGEYIFIGIIIQFW